MRGQFGALAVALGLAACSPGGNAYEGSTPPGILHRFRYVVEVSTPKGIVSGHSVIGMRYDCHPSLNGKMCDISEQSQAAAVDLPNGTTLYALLTRFSEPQWACCAPIWAQTMENGKSVYKPDKVPDLVMFENPSKPPSLKVIDPKKPFGDGYKIIRIYREKTNDPLTTEIFRRLPWMQTFEGRFNGRADATNDGPDAGRFGRHAFLEGYDNADRA